MATLTAAERHEHIDEIRLMMLLGIPQGRIAKAFDGIKPEQIRSYSRSRGWKRWLKASAEAALRNIVPEGVLPDAPQPEKPAAPPPGSQPTEFDQEVAERVCERIAAGDPLRQVCNEANYPARRTWARWRNQDNEDGRRLRAAYKTAQEDQIQSYVEDMYALALDKSIDPMRAKNAIDVVKFLAARVLSNVYGKTVRVEPVDPAEQLARMLNVDTDQVRRAIGDS